MSGSNIINPNQFGPSSEPGVHSSATGEPDPPRNMYVEGTVTTVGTRFQATGRAMHDSGDSSTHDNRWRTYRTAHRAQVVASHYAERAARDVL